MQSSEKPMIFFITSHLADLTETKYELPENNGDYELFEELSEIKIEDKNKYKIMVFSISLGDSNNGEELEINMNVAKKGIFSGKIKFNQNKVNFIYNFSFGFLTKDNKEMKAPTMKLSLGEQFNLYMEMLNNKDKFNDNSLIDTLIDDSINILKNYNNNKISFDIDFYLSLFCRSFKSGKIVDVLSCFNLKRIEPSTIVDKENITHILKEIANSTELITNHLNENENEIEKCLEKFYSLLLYYFNSYDFEKIEGILEDKNGFKFYQKILFSSNKKLFDRIVLKNSFIDEIIHNENKMDYNNIIQILKYLKFLENILIFLNRHTDMICSCLDNKEEKEEEEKEEEEEDSFISEDNRKKIDLLGVIKIRPDIENVSNIYKEMKKLLEKEKIYKYIDFGQKFWETYSEYFYKSKILEKLKEIKNIIEAIQEKDEYLIDNSEFIYKYIIQIRIQQKMDNFEILELVEDIRSSKQKIDLNIFDRLDFDIFKDKPEEKIKFIQKWKTIEFKDIYPKDNFDKFRTKIISKIKHISHFGLLFELFGDINDINNTNYKNIIEFKDRYISLINSEKNDNLINIGETFIEDSAKLIYLLETQKKEGKKFIKDDLNKRLPASLRNKIFIKLSSYKISDDLIEEITDFFSKGKDNTFCENLINNFKNVNNFKCQKQILKKLGKELLINEEIVFYHQNSNQIKVLNQFKAIGIFTDERFEHTEYVNSIKIITKEILKEIEEFKINFCKLDKMKEKDALKKSIEILNIEKTLNKDKIKKLCEDIESYRNKIKNNIDLLKKHLRVIKTFFPTDKKEDISKIEELIKKFKNKDLKQIDNEDNIKILNNYKNQYQEQLDSLIKLTESDFFKKIYGDLKEKSKIEKSEQIFEEAKLKFQKLDYLLAKNPKYKKLDEEIFKVCLDVVRKKKYLPKVEDEILKVQEYLKLIGINPDKEIDKKSIAEDLILCSQQDELKDIIIGMKLLLEKKNFKEKKIIKDLNIFLNNTFASKKELKDVVEEIRKVWKELIRKLQVNENFKDLNNNTWEIFKLFANKPQEALEFLLNTKKKDCDEYREKLSLSDNNFLTSSDINDLDICRKFLLEIEGNTEQEYIKDFINKAENKGEDKNHISIYFKRYFDKYLQFKELKKISSNIETNKKKANEISKESQFKLSINIKSNADYNSINSKGENDFISFEGKYNQKEIFFNELLELREISMLNQNYDKDKDIIKNNQIFIENIRGIIDVYNILENIAKKGYYKALTIEINIKDNQISYTSEDYPDLHKYEDFRKVLKDIRKDIESAQLEAYEDDNYELIRYIYGKQFSYIYNSLEKKSLKDNDTFLSYLTNNLFKNNLKSFELDYIKDGNNNKKEGFINIIHNCNEYLIKVFNLNNITIRDVYKQNLMLEGFDSGFYHDFAVNIGIEEAVLSYYNKMTNNYPLQQTLLICHKDTSLDELIAFLYRAILCPENVLFILGKIEEIASENIKIISDIISDLYKRVNYGKKMKSCLMFIYSKDDLHFIKYIKKLCNKLDNKQKEEKIKEGILGGDNIKIYYSKEVGVGKSTKIKNEASDKNYVYFPLGGDFQKKEVFQRLKKKDLIKVKNVVFHLDLFDTENIELLKEFLFSLLITKIYKYNDDIYLFNKEMEIKIELPVGFVGFFAKFPMLTMFKNKEKFSISSLAPLIVLKDIKSDIQIVCNYLQLYETNILLDYDLYIDGISFPELKKSKNKKDAKIIPDNECNKLIDKYLNYLNIQSDYYYANYYQKNNFIKILSGQFKRFSKIKELSIDYLKKHNSNLKKERLILIQYIIKSTKLYIKSSFDDLLKSQKIYIDFVIAGDTDIKEQNEKAAKYLESEAEKNIFSYSLLKEPLIFFHESQDSILSCISPNKTELESIKNIINIKNDYIKNNNIEFIDYDKYDQTMFYKELKKILDLPNLIDDDDKSGKISICKNTIKDIMDYYMITPDNF